MEITAEEKWSACKYRSEEEKTVTIHRCKCQGGDYRDTGYQCHIRNMFKVTPEICKFCSLYKPKPIEPLKNSN